MRICRFLLKADIRRLPRLGLMQEGGIRDVTGVVDELPALRWPLPLGDQLIANLGALRSRMDALARAAPLISRDAVWLLSPVANPGKLICAAANWSFQQVPLGTLGFLFKATSALAGEGEGVQICWPQRTTLHEAELAIVIGRQGKQIPEQDALNYVAGYTCALDMTMQRDKEDYSFCKSFDTFAVLGPCLATSDEIPDPSALSYRFMVNGDIKGERKFKDLTAGPAQLVAFASTAMTLHPGDVILCGAGGVGSVAAGDALTLEIPGIGRMDVSVSVASIDQL